MEEHLMETYIALLRGINVGTYNRIKMDTLKGIFEELGYQSIRTYIQSGNIIFKTLPTPENVLIHQISQALLKNTGFTVPVIIRTVQEWYHAIEQNPFKDRTEALNTFFLDIYPQKEDIASLEAADTGDEQFKIIGREIYVLLNNGIRESRITNGRIERKLKGRSSSRNWNTILRIAQMCRD